MFTQVKCNYTDFKIFSYNVHIFSNNLLIGWRKMGCHTGKDHSDEVIKTYVYCLQGCGGALENSSRERKLIPRVSRTEANKSVPLNKNKTKVKTNLQAWVSQGTVVTFDRSPCNLENIKPKIKAERESQEDKGTWGELRAWALPEFQWACLWKWGSSAPLLSLGADSQTSHWSVFERIVCCVTNLRAKCYPFCCSWGHRIIFWHV